MSTWPMVVTDDKAWFCRLDQTLGKPGTWIMGNDKDKQKQTIVARLTRVENQVGETKRLFNVGSTANVKQTFVLCWLV